MSDPRRYSISILENFSDKTFHEIALSIAEMIIDIQDEFKLQNTKRLGLGIDFLHTPDDPFTWYGVAEDLCPIFSEFPDVCFCVNVDATEGDNKSYRIVFFNHQHLKQYPETIYPMFHPDHFERDANENIKTIRECLEITDV